MTTKPRDMLTAKEVAKVLRISVPALYLRYQKNRPAPPCVRFGRKMLWRPEDVEQWLEEHLVTKENHER